MSKTIVSIVSEKTAPNYLVIKEMYQEGDELLYISSDRMANRIDWIEQSLVLKISATRLVLEEGEEEKWSIMTTKIEAELSKEKKYVVNLTGGTKLMALAVQRVFENYDSQFVYIPYPKNEIVNVSTGKTFDINYRLTVDEYFCLNNVAITKKSVVKSEAYSKSFFEMFVSDAFSQSDLEIIKRLQMYRSKRTFTIGEYETKPDEEKKPQIPNLGKFLEKIAFPFDVKGELSKYEVQYLTGGWFEEYVYYLVEKNLNPKDMAIGVFVEKSETTNMNDLDVVFTLGNKLYVIECKTGGTDENRLFNEVVYKASALKERLFSLSGNSYIFSLSSAKGDLVKIAKNLNTSYYTRETFLSPIEQQALLDSICKYSND